MSRTVHLCLVLTCEDEEDYDSATDSIMDVAKTWGAAMSGRAWHVWPDDAPQGTGGPAAVSTRSEGGFDSRPGVCPECGSTDVSAVPGTLPVCRSCDWTGWDVNPEVPIE